MPDDGSSVDSKGREGTSAAAKGQSREQPAPFNWGGRASGGRALANAPSRGTASTGAGNGAERTWVS